MWIFRNLSPCQESTFAEFLATKRIHSATVRGDRSHRKGHQTWSMDENFPLRYSQSGTAETKFCATHSPHFTNISPLYIIYDGSRTPSNELWLHGYGFPMVSLSKIPFVHWIAQSLTRWPSSPVLPPASAGRWLDSGRPRVWADTDILERIKVSAENTWTW